MYRIRERTLMNPTVRGFGWRTHHRLVSLESFSPRRASPGGVSLVKRWDESAVGFLLPVATPGMRVTLHILRSTVEVHNAVSMALVGSREHRFSLCRCRLLTF